MTMGKVMSKSILIADPTVVKLEPEPISRDWVLSGAPEGSSKVLARSSDWLLTLVVWECTPGRFEWHYKKDEIVFVLSGAVTITTDRGEQRSFGAGDVVFFPAGSMCTWEVTERIRKVAVLRDTLWTPVGMCIAVCSRVMRMIGWRVVRLRRALR